VDNVGLGKAAILDLRGKGKAKHSGAFALFCCRNLKSDSVAVHSAWLRDFVVVVISLCFSLLCVTSTKDRQYCVLPGIGAVFSTLPAQLLNTNCEAAQQELCSDLRSKGDAALLAQVPSDLVLT